MPNLHKLGAYVAPQHDNWQAYLAAIRPPWVRILMPGENPTSKVCEVYELCPDADISLRWWDIDDGGDGNKASKLGAADVGARAMLDIHEMVRRVEAMEVEAKRIGRKFPDRARLWFNGLNEPQDYPRPLVVRYNVSGAKQAAASGFGFLHLEYSVGHPSEWPPKWGWAEEVFESIEMYDGRLALHEYWQPEGPHHEWTDAEGNKRSDWGALAGRYLHLPADVPIVITECGVDGRIYGRHATPDTGYAKFMPAGEYAVQLKDYLWEVGKDKRIEAVLPFITDVADKEWSSFNTIPAKDAFVEMLARLDDEKPDGSVYTVNLPALFGGGQGSEQPGLPSNGVVEPAPYVFLDPHVMRAILEVESGGNGFNDDGSLKIRFEAHIFERYVGKFLFGSYFRYDPHDILNAWFRPTLANEWHPIHRSQVDEYRAFEVAKNLPTGAFEAAYLSMSMGAAQIMGFNYHRVGFKSASAMYEAFVKDFRYQYIAFYNFIMSDNALVRAISERNWREVARLYNGPGLVDLYSARLELAYKRFSGEK